MTDRKPTAGFWITVALVAMLVGYPLSFGPACWLCDHDCIPERPAAWAYKPLIVAAFSGPEQIRRILRRYAEWGAPPNGLILSVDPIGDDGHGGFIFPAPTEYADWMVFGVLERLRDTD